MLPLLLIPFLPILKDLVVKHILPSFNGKGVDKKDVKVLAKKLYAKLPSNIPFVGEKAFVDFCLKHQDKLFPQKTKKTTTAKKIAPAKNAKAVSNKKSSAKKKTVTKKSVVAKKTTVVKKKLVPVKKKVTISKKAKK